MAFNAYRPIPKATYNTAQNTYVVAFENSRKATEEYMKGLQKINNAMVGNFEETEGNDMSALMVARWGSTATVERMIDHLTYERKQKKEGYDTTTGKWTTPPVYYNDPIKISNDDGTTTNGFINALQKLKALEVGQLRGWRTDPMDTAALFLVYLLELRDLKIRYNDAMRERMKTSLQALVTMALPFPEQFQNMEIEYKSITSTTRPEGYFLGKEPHDDPRMWGTAADKFMDTNAFGREVKYRTGPYDSAPRRELPTDSRLHDEESTWAYTSASENFLTNLGLSHDPNLGYHVNGISFDMFFNLYRKALSFKGKPNEDESKKWFWETMNSYRYIVSHDEKTGHTNIYLARASKHTGAPINGGQLALRLPLNNKDQAINEFVRVFPHVSPADAALSSVGEFESTKELGTWIARQDKSNFQWVVRVESRWQHPTSTPQIGNIKNALVAKDRYTTYRPFPFSLTHPNTTYTGRDNLSWLNKYGWLAPLSGARTISHIEVFAVPKTTIQAMDSAARKIPEKALKAWEGAIAKWNKWLNTIATNNEGWNTDNIAGFLDSWDGKHRAPASNSSSNRTIANNYGYYGMGDLWLLTPTLSNRAARSSTSTIGSGMWKGTMDATYADTTEHVQMAGLKKFVDYIASGEWLGVHTKWDASSKQGQSSNGLHPIFKGYGDSAYNSLMQGVNFNNVVRIYKGAVDGINDVGAVLSELSKTGAFENMSEAPVFDFPDFTIKFQGTSLDDNTGQMVPSGNVFETPFAPIPPFGLKTGGGILALPVLHPVLSYERSSGFGADMLKWLNREGHGLNGESIWFRKMGTGVHHYLKIPANKRGESNVSKEEYVVTTADDPELEQWGWRPSPSHPVGPTDHGRWTTTTYQRIPVRTNGVSGKRYNSRHLLSNSTLPISAISTPGIKLPAGGEGIIAAPTVGAMIWGGILAVTAFRGLR